jgi:hypothetical protein
MKRAVLLMTCCLGLLSTTGCDADDSAPTHSARNPLFESSDKSKDNAEHRALEGPPRELPMGEGREYPGASKIDVTVPGDSIILADVAAVTPAPDNDNAITPASMPANATTLMAPETAAATTPAPLVAPAMTMPVAATANAITAPAITAAPATAAAPIVVAPAPMTMPMTMPMAPTETASTATAPSTETSTTAPIAPPALNGAPATSTAVIVPPPPMPFPADTQAATATASTTMTATSTAPGAFVSITSPVTSAPDQATTNIAAYETPMAQIYTAPPNGVIVPGSGYSLDKSWGTLTPLKNYPHRPNATSKAVYYSGTTLNNSIYFYGPKLPDFINGPDHSTFGPSSGTRSEMGGGQYFVDTYAGEYTRVVADSVYFAGNIVALPVLMIKDPPLAQRTSQDPEPNPTFHSSLATGGEIVPYMTPGKVEWQYPQAVNPYANNGQTGNEPGNPTYVPAPENAPAAVPDPFTQPATQPAAKYSGK